MNAFPTTTPYSNGPYPVGQVSDVIYGNDTTSFLYQQQGSHYGHQQEDVFYHQSQPNWDAYHPNNTYHNSDSNYHQRSHASRGRDCPYPVSPSTSIQAPAAYSRHPGGGVAPLVDARNAHIPPLYTINAHSTTSNTSHTYSTGHGAGYETSNPHGHSHKHGDQLVQRNRSSSISSSHSSPYPTRRPSQSSAPFTGPAARPPRKVNYNDTRCVMKSARGIPLGPTNHIIIPQQPFFDENQMANLESFRQESVSFQLERFPELGVRISDALGDEPILVGGNDMVFDKDVYKEIKLRILWPGYSRFPFERRLKTRDTKASRSLVLMLLSRAIADFIKHVNHNRIPVEQGFERWEVGMHRPSITSKDLFVTGLIHRGGSNWQPEIWCPSNRAN